MLVRISEIEIYPQYRDAYLEAALEVGATSVREEPGVIAIFPMIQQRDSCQVRILEIYASPEAYRHHIGTAHFQTYKQGTLHMVKTLDLVDMIPMNPAAMPEIFRKMQRVK
ncbi:MAG TPA: antibiotic biosynthesis monooxygenase [Candidatus Barnesiella merdigallinarum]|nr:antibiotic biosynthesis monooxygenase [Candidatus Barnesiella merdigallinarum]